MYQRTPRQRRASLLLGDLGIVALCITAVFWLLYSPLVPYEFTSLGAFLVATVVGGLALGGLGVWLNHRAARHEERRPSDRRPRR